MKSGKWSNDEVEWLKENYPIYGVKYCTEKLSRSKDSIRGKVQQLKLKYKKEFVPLISKDLLEKEYLDNFKTCNDIAIENNISYSCVRKYLRFYNIRIREKSEYKGKGHKNWKGFGEISARRWASIQSDAKSRNLDFNITIKYAWKLFVKQKCKCALSGREIFFCTSFYCRLLGEHYRFFR